LRRSISAGIGGPITSPFRNSMASFGKKLLEHARRAYQDVANQPIAGIHELMRDATS
jgi:hypothetical protein